MDVRIHCAEVTVSLLMSKLCRMDTHGTAGTISI